MILTLVTAGSLNAASITSGAPSIHLGVGVDGVGVDGGGVGVDGVGGLGVSGVVDSFGNLGSKAPAQ